MISAIERAIVECPPVTRRRIAIHVLIWSALAMLVNDVIYLGGWITERDLVFITLNLSWFALTITAADLVATTDVRESSQ